MSQDMKEVLEEWRPVVGYEGWYDVSNHGRVKRVRPGRNTHIGKILEPWLSGSNYLRVCLTSDGKRNHFDVHRLVARAFIGPVPPGHEVNHKGGVKTNNRPGNLEYVTRQQNLLHRTRILKIGIGEGHHCAKLTNENVREIRRALAEGVSGYSLAKRFDVRTCTIYKIKHGQAWRHVA